MEHYLSPLIAQVLYTSPVHLYTGLHTQKAYTHPGTSSQILAATKKCNLTLKRAHLPVT